MRDFTTYVKMMSKVAFYSLGMLLFFIAINVLPVIAGNIFNSTPIFTGTFQSLIISIRLWGLFFGVLSIICSLIYWGAPKNNGRSSE